MHTEAVFTGQGCGPRRHGEAGVVAGHQRAGNNQKKFGSKLSLATLAFYLSECGGEMLVQVVLVMQQAF